MSLEQWHKNGWLRPHETNRQQIADLLAIADRDLVDASTARLSSDWQFGIAYNAALKLCTVLLYAEGYRPDRALAHYRKLQSLPLILGNDRKEDADYLDTCRAKRNTVEYDVAGRTSSEEAAELIGFASELKKDVLDWLERKHPRLS
ncbi:MULTISPECIES: hypothetical protein [unclassified Lentimonas]|uniref:hypothetical protein n=1 Tax=unclassified Lentimonas TaxID=2630993 RepID=UPI001323CFC2|nr:MULTISPECIES: hypothetical protein [unclassified Lentimonas]CAA6691199.1 Unannotated [Lentimonas sp. CC19]CAA6694764.1 Unannotated [Lentimonas sp. CC10]CAA7071578.1 Unannotated [Lentimonas sp. CC11]